MKPVWENFCGVIRRVYPETAIVPYQLNGGTDSRSYHGICEHVYKFSPFYMSLADRKSVHGIDEKISKEGFSDLLRFYGELLRIL